MNEEKTTLDNYFRNDYMQLQTEKIRNERESN